MLRVDGIEPSPAEVAARRYGLLRPLSLVTGRAPRPATLRFIDFARGPEGQQILAKKFFPVASR
jgi:ABC-type phosphate transport system substrate-binding protein